MFGILGYIKINKFSSSKYANECKKLQNDWKH